MRRGNPTGVLVDRGDGARLAAASPRRERDRAARGHPRPRSQANRWGLTSVHDAGVEREVIDVFEEVAKAGQFSVRNYVMIRSDDSTLAHYFRRGPQSGLYDGRLWIKAIKISADGALGRAARRCSNRTATTRRTAAWPSSSRARRAGGPAAPCSTASSSTCTPSATAPTASCSTPTSPRSRRRRAPTIASAWSTPRSSTRGHPALRPARGHPVHAGLPPDERHVLGRQPARTAAAARLVRVALAPQLGRDHPQRERFPGRETNPLISFHSPSRARMPTTTLPAAGFPSSA
jgi:hypothetical protein